ncbi:MAG: glutamate synthase [Dehalococcoidia bacterium]
MVDIDAAGMTTREINLRVRELALRGEEIRVLNPQARHNLAVGILTPCKITFEGSVGYFCASLVDGPEVVINGNAGWALGDNLMSGKIVLSKNAGASVASTMRGGEVFVGGNAGARAGISMKGGTLIVRGNTGFVTGFMMQKGRIIICGDVGDGVGDSMYEGTIYVAGKVGSLGSDAKTEEPTEDELASVWSTLERYGISDRHHFKKIVSAKKLYHFDSLERLEKQVI